MDLWPLRSSIMKFNFGSFGSFGIHDKPKVSLYHCVELTFPYGADACETAVKLHKRRFLSADAPLIPIPGCNQHCRCRFKHHHDRRHELRRDSYNTSGLYIHFSQQKNRRLGGDRRLNSYARTELK